MTNLEYRIISTGPVWFCKACNRVAEFVTTRFAPKASFVITCHGETVTIFEPPQTSRYWRVDINSGAASPISEAGYNDADK